MAEPGVGPPAQVAALDLDPPIPRGAARAFSLSEPTASAGEHIGVNFPGFAVNPADGAVSLGAGRYWKRVGNGLRDAPACGITLERGAREVRCDVGSNW